MGALSGCTSSDAAPTDSDEPAATSITADGAAQSVPSAARDGQLAPSSDAGATAPSGLDLTTDGALPADDAGPPTATIAACLPSAAGPYSLREGEPLTLVLKCGSGAPSADYQLAFQDLPEGATFDGAAHTLRWTPALDQAAVYQLAFSAAATGETGSVKVAIADRWDDPANAPITDEHTYTEEYGLPVLHLHTASNINDGEYTPAPVSYRGHDYGAEAKLRGATSSLFPKRSYTVKFTKADKFSEPAFAGGFLKKRKIVLVSPFNDNSYLRTRLAFDLWNTLDPEHIQVQSYSAVVFLNGVYHGLYTVVDHVDEYLMEDFGLSQEGNLYKARTHEANFMSVTDKGLPKLTLHQGYTKEEGTPAEGEAGAFDDLDALVGWIANATPESFKSEIDTRIVRKEYEDWWLFVSFILAGDSVGKNSYHYHDPLLPGSRWRYIPWDLDESFGQDYRTMRVRANAQLPEQGRYVDLNYLTVRLLSEPTLGPALRARYGQTLREAFALDALLARLDVIAAEIEASALRDEQRWGVTYRTYRNWADRKNFLSHQEEVKYVRQWLIDRHAVVDAVY